MSRFSPPTSLPHEGDDVHMRVPIYLTKQQFIATLVDILDRVAKGDSYEGSLSYEMPWSAANGDPSTDPPGEGFRVLANYRVGNLMGQGGMRTVGLSPDPSTP